MTSQKICILSNLILSSTEGDSIMYQVPSVLTIVRYKKHDCCFGHCPSALTSFKHVSSGISLSVIKFCFRCNDGERHRIIFYVGEKLVPYDGCNVGLCSWSFIKDKFSNIARDCNLDFCYYGRSGSQKHLPIYWITVAVVTVVTFCRRNFK